MKTIQLPKKVLEDLPEIKDQIVRMEYIKGDKRKPIGVILKTKEGYYGWSLCNSKDKWDRNLGVKKAFYRTRKKLNSEDVLFNIRFNFIFGNRISYFESAFEAISTEWNDKDD